jgi:hypothetical protein
MVAACDENQMLPIIRPEHSVLEGVDDLMLRLEKHSKQRAVPHAEQYDEMLGIVDILMKGNSRLSEYHLP